MKTMSENLIHTCSWRYDIIMEVIEFYVKVKGPLCTRLEMVKRGGRTVWSNQKNLRFDSNGSYDAYYGWVCKGHFTNSEKDKKFNSYD